jgi:signal transduction histidine kinase/HAMP domain-containing protein
MTLRWRLLAAQGILALALLAVGVVAVTSLRTLGRSADTILQDNYRSVLAAQRIKDAAERLDSAALFRVAGRVDRAQEQAQASLRTLEEELAVQERNITERGEREATARLRVAWREYQEAFARLEGLQDREALARAYFDDLEPRFIAVKAAAQQILDINQDAMVGKAERARRQAASLVLVVVVATAIGVLAGTLLSSWVTTRVVRPVSVVAQAAQRIAAGDMAARARVRGRDEIAALAAEFNAMADRLAEYRRSSLGELLQAQQAAQAAIDGLPDPVLVLDVGGQVQNLNQAAEAVLRLPHGAGDLVAALDPPLREVVDRVRSHVLGGHGAWQPKGYEEAVRLDLPDGARWLLPRATPLHSEAGAVTGVAIVLQDVSRLMRVDELKNDLVATVAHEFRTPLTSLRMAIHLCVEEAAGPLTEKQADLLLAARQDCERLQGIVDDLLDLSRIQGGRMELLRHPVPARALLEEAVEASRDAAGAAGLRLSIRGAVEDEVAADAERVGLVLSNLIANAIRHTDAGGEVVLEASRSGDRVRFEVRDTGEGIPREYLERIFERFFRVPGRGGGGVGLGLYLVREIVQAHGGEVGVESEPAKGSRFWFTLPVAAGPAEA